MGVFKGEEKRSITRQRDVDYNRTWKKGTLSRLAALIRQATQRRAVYEPGKEGGGKSSCWLVREKDSKEGPPARPKLLDFPFHSTDSFSGGESHIQEEGEEGGGKF